IFSLTFVFLVLMLSSLFCSLTDPKCFLRIKDKENQDGDKELDCFFSIYTKSGHVKNDHFSGNLDKQLTPKNVHLILSLYFAMEEINRNPHILPNISLLVNIKCNLIADQKRSGISAKRSENFPNYYCRNQRKYFIVLTGPMWVLPATLGPFLYMSKTPQVSWKLKDCSTTTLLKWIFSHKFGMSMSDSSYNLYNAVYAVAHSLHKMLLQQVDILSENPGKGLEFDSWQMFSLLKNIQFVNPAGDLVNMNQKTKKDTEYDIFYITDFNQHFGLKVKIGKFSGHSPKDQKLCISDEMIEWATDFRQTPPSICSRPCGPGHRKSPQEGKAICCFECNPCPENEISNMTNMDHCLKCPDDQYSNAKQTHCLKKVVTFLAYEDPLGMCLVGLALCFSSLTAAILTILFKYQDTPIVKANNRVLSYVLLISLIFCFLCPLLYIGHPHMATCILQQITFAIVFTVATSSVLAKTITVVLAFKITVPDRRMRWLLASGAPNFIIPMCTVIQLIICGIWMGTSPPFVDEDVHAEHGHILIVCNKGSVIAFYYVLGYLGSLSLASFTVAFLARNLPDTFNEAKFLTFSMLVVCSVWITFIPVYQSTKGKATVAVEIFCILASSAGLLFCIFAPKCYIILFKPQINSFHKFWNIHLKDE
uniref:G-protein coupled receptors family 3 profile domain-containing protein n=1 Tax=Peromyscus maniculatus bairdii TaxID=230844 RepID=A0A8C8T8X3_PERMB